MSKAHSYSHSKAHSPTFPLLHLSHNSFSNPSVALPSSQLILQLFCCFTYITVHSPTLLSLYLHHSSFSNSSVASPTSQFILQPFCHFTYVTAHSPTLPLLQELILQPFRHFTYITAHSDSPTFPSLYLHYSSFSNSSVASPMSQLILQPFFHFSYITGSSLTSPGEPPMVCLAVVNGYSLYTE